MNLFALVWFPTLLGGAMTSAVVVLDVTLRRLLSASNALDCVLSNFDKINVVGVRVVGENTRGKWDEHG